MGAQDLILRIQNELWRGQNQRKTCPKELWASDSEALEVSGPPRGDQGSFKEGSKSSKVTIHGACRVIMSPQGAAGSPKELRRSRLRPNMKLKVAQKSSAELFESLKNDIKIKNENVCKAIEKTKKTIDA